MGKLIKYELRKQRTSRMVIFIALAVALVCFWAGIAFNSGGLRDKYCRDDVRRCVCFVLHRN